MSQYLSGRRKGFVALRGSVGVVVVGVVVVAVVVVIGVVVVVVVIVIGVVVAAAGGVDDDKVFGMGLEGSLMKIGVGLERSSEVIDEVNGCPDVCDLVEKV